MTNMITMMLHRPHVLGDVDLNVPSDAAIIPNTLLKYSNILETVLNIRNASLRKAILARQDTDYSLADIIFTIEEIWGQPFKIGDFVNLKLDVVAQPSTKRIFQIVEVNQSYEIKNIIFF